jgi:hypothetical protein
MPVRRSSPPPAPAEATEPFLRSLVAESEREFRDASVNESEIASFKRGYEAGGRFRLAVDAVAAQRRARWR